MVCGLNLEGPASAVYVEDEREVLKVTCSKEI